MDRPVTSPEAAREVLQSAVDVYVHARPDLLARRLDDLALATELKRDGFRAAVHRHHFAPTAERAKLASDATGFELLGAVLLNGTAGGLNPQVVDHAIRMGTRWVSLPSLSARRFQQRENGGNPYSDAAVALAGRVDVLDRDGRLVPAVHEILELVAKSGVVLSLGYIDFADCVAVLAAAREHRVGTIVATNPASINGFSLAQMTELMAFPGMTFEFAASSVRSFLGGAPSLQARDLVALIRRFGVERCLMSSDSGHTGAPTTLELMAAACVTLGSEGMTAQELRTLVRDTPSRLVGLAPS